MTSPAAPLACRIDAGPYVEHAEFTAWLPPASTRVRGMLALVPGFNGDGRHLVNEPAWQAYARRHAFGLIGVRFVSPQQPHDRRHTYCAAGDGSGRALLEAVASLAVTGGHPEAAEAPLLLWGASAGGQFSYEFACWRPARVISFAVMKGGFYASHLAPRATQLVPGILCVGERDEGWRIDSLKGIYAVNRQCGARWTLVQEPGVGHHVGGCGDLALRFFDAVLPQRLPGSASSLSTTPPDDVWRGDARTGEVSGAAMPDRALDVWLPDEGFAAAWSAFVRGGRPAG